MKWVLIYTIRRHKSIYSILALAHSIRWAWSTQYFLLSLRVLCRIKRLNLCEESATSHTIVILTPIDCLDLIIDIVWQFFWFHCMGSMELVMESRSKEPFLFLFFHIVIMLVSFIEHLQIKLFDHSLDPLSPLSNFISIRFIVFRIHVFLFNYHSPLTLNFIGFLWVCIRLE